MNTEYAPVSDQTDAPFTVEGAMSEDCFYWGFATDDDYAAYMADRYGASWDDSTDLSQRYNEES